MSPSLIDRFVEAARKEIALGLEGLCAEIGAAESSILFPSGGDLLFFASTNPNLMDAGAPRVPINASYSGAAFCSGQTLAVADAAGKVQHYGAVDAATHEVTHEFAAIPIADQAVLAVLTLVNRKTAQDRPRPFDLAELRRAEAFAAEAATAFRRFPGLRAEDAQGGQPSDNGAMQAVLTRLSEGERRTVAALAGALIKNRGR